MDYRRYMDAKSAELWSLFVDIVGPEHCWPAWAVQLFFENHLKNKDRFKIMVFSFVNGLNPVLVVDWCEHRRVLRDVAALRHLVYVANQLERGKFNNYFSFNVSWSRYEYADGREMRMRRSSD